MRITNELKSYVNSRIEALIPAPSGDELKDLNKFVESVKLDFKKIMDTRAQEYVDQFIKENPDFAECDVQSDAYRHHVLNINVQKHPVSKEYNRQIEEYGEFKQNVTVKCIALLSVQKEVEDLDTFIANVVSSIK
jgi:hypothetical protein